VEEYFHGIQNRKFEQLRKLLHSNYSYTSADGERHEGADAAIEIGEMYTNAFPDLQFEIKHMNVAGNVVVTEFYGIGTHRGELMGIAPTGKKVKIPVCNVLEVRDDKIYAEREYFDSAVMMRQLGVEAPRQKAAV